jgi:hypothetical protein
MMIAGVHYGRAPRKIGLNGDFAWREPETPRLSIMTVGRQRRVADKFFKARML